MAGEPDAVVLMRDWAEAWNACDADRLLELVHADFRMHRLKGDAVDREGLRAAVERQTHGAVLKIVPRRLYGRDSRYAALARIEFRHVEEDELIGAEDEGGVVVELRDGLVALMAPKLTAAEALTEAGLTEADLIAEWEDR